MADACRSVVAVFMGIIDRNIIISFVLFLATSIV
jgi:hypothetical protein